MKQWQLSKIQTVEKLQNLLEFILTKLCLLHGKAACSMQSKITQLIEQTIFVFYYYYFWLNLLSVIMRPQYASTSQVTLNMVVESYKRY